MMVISPLSPIKVAPPPTLGLRELSRLELGIADLVPRRAVRMVVCDAGEGLELTSLLSKAGLDAEQGTSFLAKIVGFIKEKAGEEIFSQITEKIPALKSVLG